MDQAEDIRHTIGIKEIYHQRKEIIERVFADAKEKHGMRYTQYRGLAKVKMERNLLFGCMNLKRIANWKWKNRLCFVAYSVIIKLINQKRDKHGSKRSFRTSLSTV
jgi:hypothetical protein